MAPKKSAQSEKTLEVEYDSPSLVQVRLAHPLDKKYGEDLGFTREAMDAVTDLRKIPVGTLLTLTRSGASSLIGSGYAQVDPEDTPVVAAVLSGEVVGEAGATVSKKDAENVDAAAKTQAASTSVGTGTGNAS